MYNPMFRLCFVVLLIIFCNSFPVKMSAEEPKKFYEMTIDEIDSFIREISTHSFTNAEKIVLYSDRFLGTDYELKCLADGPDAKYEPGPLINFKQTNCMTYCEHVLALALSSHYEEMFNILQHIRYKNGIIGMATRNHYTMVDWLPHNNWCLEDVSQKVGQDYAQTLTRTISHRKFFTDKKYTDILNVLPDRTVTIYYIPEDKIMDCIDRLNSGDIVAVIQDKPDIFSAHMGLIIKKDSKSYFRHASMSKDITLDEPLEDYVNSLLKSKRLMGMSFMRVKEEINWLGPENITHGKVIR